jgi:branched-chain amino acid transport system ATP-binding protein
MAETLHALRARRPFTMLLVEQNLGFIQALSDRVLILQKGAITSEVPPDVTRDRQMIEDFVGIA